MPTPRGWMVALLGAAIAIVGRVFGSQVVVQLGYALIILLFAALIVVRLGRHDLVVHRKISPERAQPSEPVTASLLIENRGRGSAPLLLVEDRLPPGLSGKPRFALHGIERGGRREASFRLFPARRGRYQTGPAEISIVDPFGMARLKSSSPTTSTLLVHPPVEQLQLPRDPGDRRSVAATATRNPSGSRGEDFYTLREYVEGDDLRKVHWPATAKRDRFMIRQEETPWHTRATILLDDFSGSHGGPGDSSFERAVVAAASLVDLYHRVGYTYRFAGTVKAGLPPGRGGEHRTRCLDQLSLLAPDTNDSGDPLRDKLVEFDLAGSPEAALLLVTGTITPQAAAAIAHGGRRFRQVAVMAFPAHRFAETNTKARWAGEKQLNDVVRLLAGASIRCVALGPDEPVAAAWMSMWQTKSSGNEGPWGRRPELV